MKKKLFLTLVISILCLFAFVFAVSAKEVDIQIKDVNGDSIVLSTVDDDGDSLTWYRITEKPTDGTYFEYVDENTTYYIVSVKTKDAAYVNDDYRLCYSYAGLKTGAWNSNIIATNVDGITHEDGNGPEYFNFVFEGTPICYAYIPASMLGLKGPSGNTFKPLFYGCSSLVELDIESGSKIEELSGNGFYNCKKLSYIRLPENLKTINSNSFVGMNLTIVVPKTVITFEVSNWANLVVLFTGTESDHAGWTYQPSNITYVEHCDEYHGGEHLANEDDFDCTTSLLCVNCGKALAESQDSHNMITICEYAKGFLSAGIYERKCNNKGCAYVEQSEDLQALFTCQGYSAPEYGNGGMLMGFVINKSAISKYTDATGKQLSYGLFAGLDTNLGTNEAVSTEGVAQNGAVSVDFTNRGYDIMEIKVVGFKTDDHKKAQIVLGAYVIEVDGEKKTVSYLQSGEIAEGKKYSYVSYNSLVIGE